MRTPGRVNLIGLAMIVAIIFGIGWSATIGPLYLERFDVVDAVSIAANTLRKGNTTQQVVRDTLIVALDQIGSHKELDEQGVMTEVRGLGVPDEDIILELVDGTAIAQVTYRRTISLPFTGDPHTEVFVIRKEESK